MLSPSLHDTSFEMEFATREAREATFIPPSKRSKAGWPHKTPTAAELARAGFYYKPSPHSNDNTVCFLCDRNLDGWEKDDDPVQEHLKHAEDCSWAMLMSIEAVAEHDTANMIDPTASELVNARKATFAIGWPHEEKRGWTCKTEKMVEAGWYFAPTQGSEDYVSCAYCKLSLDGWEPKDNPFEEHYSRSPSCPFFVFAGSTAPSKRPKAKKGRASRTSKASTRLSTQSNATVQSEAPSIPDLDESIDNSAVSLMSTASTATTKGKRKAGASRSNANKSKRTKTARSKKAAESTAHNEDDTTAAESISYPQMSQSEVQQSQMTDLNDLEPTQPSTTVGSALQQPEVEEVTGPPSIDHPAIPAQPESPGPLPSQKSRVSSSSHRSSVRRKEKAATPLPQSSPSQQSDLENAPPSTRPETARPPLSSPGEAPPRWEAIDIEMVFENMVGSEAPNPGKKDNMTASEQQMTVQDWIRHIAEKAESDLRLEGERVVGVFEKEGQKALTVLEGIVCV